MKSAEKLLCLTLVLSLCLFVFQNQVYSQEKAGQLFEKALYHEESEGDLEKAIDLFEKIVKQFSQHREVAAKALLHIGLCYEKLGMQEAQQTYHRVIDD